MRLMEFRSLEAKVDGLSRRRSEKKRRRRLKGAGLCKQDRYLLYN